MSAGVVMSEYTGKDLKFDLSNKLIISTSNTMQKILYIRAATTASEATPAYLYFSIYVGALDKYLASMINMAPVFTITP